MAVQRVAGEVAGIGLVIAHEYPCLGAQPLQQRQGQAVVLGIEHADMPGPHLAPLELRREAVDRQDHSVVTLRRKPCQRVVIGAVEGGEATLGLRGIRISVGRDDRAVIEPHQHGRVMLAPVRVDDQPGKARQDQRRVEVAGQVARQPLGPDIIGDVAGHIGLRQPKVAAIHAIRHEVGRMVAGDQPAGRAVGAVDLIGLGCPGLVSHRRMSHTPGCAQGPVVL